MGELHVLERIIYKLLGIIERRLGDDDEREGIDAVVCGFEAAGGEDEVFDE